MVKTCNHCGGVLRNDVRGRGGVQPRRRFCSDVCRHQARNRTRRRPTAIICQVCGDSRTLLYPANAGASCRKCAADHGIRAAIAANTQPALTRFAEFVALTDDGCWQWLGYIQPNGYGRFFADTPVLAHRWAYEHFAGALDDGLQIDHVCRNRSCVNPGHLDQVTAAENIRRMNEFKAMT